MTQVGAGAEEGRRDAAEDGAAVEGGTGTRGGEKEGTGEEDSSPERNGKTTNAGNAEVRCL